MAMQKYTLHNNLCQNTVFIIGVHHPYTQKLVLQIFVYLISLIFISFYLVFQALFRGKGNSYLFKRGNGNLSSYRGVVIENEHDYICDK